mmetsp:Transcript_15380/g.22698  ORF Transcript_15380/g.22698 Transcript_15380/m.22698 type:complete len:96 (-) Transcript_15380:378-665(-)
MWDSSNGSWAGIRVVSDRLGKFISDEINILGTDDGVEWWALTGTFLNRLKGEIQIGEDTAVISSGTIEIGNGCQWIKMNSPQMNFHELSKQSETE